MNWVGVPMLQNKGLITEKVVVAGWRGREGGGGGR